MYLTGIIKGVARHCYAAPSVDPNWMWQYGIRNANKWIPCGRKNPLPFLSCLRSLPSALKVSQKGNGSPKRVETIGVYPFGTPEMCIRDRFKLKDSIKKGYSTRTIVKMVPSKPWYGNWESEEVSYKEVYDDSITFNKYARKMVYDRLKWNIKQGRYPALVVCKFIAHCEKLCKYFKKKLGSKYNIACVHVDTPSKIRQQIMKDFREGKIDILVSTTIIARGKNFPKLRYLLNAASMDSQEKSIQFLGRLVRTDKSKKKVYLDDLHYPGPYLDRHGKHRKQYYQRQELKVILLDKLWKKHPNHSLIKS